MSAAGFWCTVVGLTVEMIGLGLVATGIKRRLREHGPQRVVLGQAVEHERAMGIARGVVDTERLTVDDRVRRLEQALRSHEKATSDAMEKQRTDLNDRIDETYCELRKRLSDADSRLRRIGLGDVRGDWIGLVVAGFGVLLALIGAVLSQLA